MFNGIVQSHEQEESGAHTLTDDKIISNSFNKNNVVTKKTNKILTKLVLLGLLNRCNGSRIDTRSKIFGNPTFEMNIAA